MGLGSRNARRHETRGVAKVGSADQTSYWEHKPGDSVMTADGFLGTVEAVHDGPFPGSEIYRVVLSNGIGGGEYTASQLTKKPSATASAVEASTAHTADVDYPELGNLLVERPDIAIDKIGSKTADYNRLDYEHEDPYDPQFHDWYVPPEDDESHSGEEESEPRVAAWRDRDPSYGMPEHDGEDYDDEPSEPEGPDRDDARVEIGTNRWGTETAYHAHHGPAYLGHFPDEAQARAALWDHENEHPGYHPNHWVDGHLDTSGDRAEYEKDPHGWLMKNSPDYEKAQQGDIGHDVDEAMEGSEHLKGLLDDGKIGPTKYSSLEREAGWEAKPCECPGAKKVEPHTMGEHPDWAARNHTAGNTDPWGHPLMKAFDGHGAWDCNNYDCEEHPQSMYPGEGQPQAHPGWLTHDGAGPEERQVRKQVNDAISGTEWLLDQQHEGPTKYSSKTEDEDSICICDAYAPEKRPGNCPIHGSQKTAAVPNAQRDKDDLTGNCLAGEHDQCEDYADSNCLCQCHDHWGVPNKYKTGWQDDQYYPERFTSTEPHPGHTASLDEHLGLIAEAARDEDFRFHVTASWSDVRQKAQRLRGEDRVRIVAAHSGTVVAEVRGDHHTYETGLQYVPGARKVATWQCGCKWAAYAWGRSRAYKRFEGRMCSHALAVQYEAQSRGMFGRDIKEDSHRMPGQHQRTPVVVEYDKDTGRNRTRRTVPPGNMRTVWSKAIEAAPVVTAVAHLVTGDDAAEVGVLLRTAGISEEYATSLAKAAAIEKRDCSGCMMPTTAKGLCSHCQRHQVIPIDHGSMDTDLGLLHADKMGEIHHKAKAEGWDRSRVSQNAKMVNLRFVIEQAKRDKENPKPGFYAHPELNELAEMTHEMRHGEGGDPTWLPSQFQRPPKQAAVNDAWGDGGGSVNIWSGTPSGGTKPRNPLDNPASSGWASSPDPVGWSAQPLSMGDRTASWEEPEHGETDVCGNCGETIRYNTVDPNVPWTHLRSGNSKCDVSNPSDAVMLQGVDSGEAHPLVHSANLNDEGTAIWDSTSPGTVAMLDDEPEGALPSTDGDLQAEASGAEGLLGAETDMMSPVYDDILSPQSESIQTVGSVEDIVAQFQRTAGAAALQKSSPRSTGSGPSDGDIAAAAKAHLEKTALKAYSPAEQRQIINESGKASNLDRLDIADTHYAALDEMRGDEDDLDLLW